MRAGATGSAVTHRTSARAGSAGSRGTRTRSGRAAFLQLSVRTATVASPHAQSILNVAHT